MEASVRSLLEGQRLKLGEGLVLQARRHKPEEM